MHDYMKIFFKNITIQGNPLVWKLDEKTNQATCLMYCVKTDHSRVEPHITPEMFKDFPDIIFEDGKFIIKDVRNFNSPYQSIEHLEEIRKKIAQPGSAMLRQQSSFFQNRKDKAYEGTTSTSNRDVGRRRSVSSTSLPLYSRIILDELIKNDPSSSSLWGDTVAYESYFEQKTSKDAKSRRAIFLKSVFSFNVMVQYEKNLHLYPLKSKLIKQIRELLDLLDPIYMNWCNQNMDSSREAVYRYFQNAVLEAMLNGKFNNKATEFETPELAKFNPSLKKYAIEKARALRAELMLMKFNILISDELPLELALDEKEVKNAHSEMTSFRTLVLKQPAETVEHIKQVLKKMADLIIESGIREESNQQLTTQLNNELRSQASVIMDFHSFQALLTVQLAKQLSDNKKELLPDIVAKVAKEVIIKINRTFKMEHGQYIAPLSDIVDKDFYLCKEWAEELAVKLAEIKLKHPKEEKKVLAYADAVADKVVSYIQNQLNDLIPTHGRARAVDSGPLSLM